MSIEFSIAVTSIKLECEPGQQTAMPTRAVIELTINGLPVIIWPCIWPDGNGRLRLMQPRDPGMPWAWTGISLPADCTNPYRRDKLSAIFAWDQKILPALARRLDENWSKDEARQISSVIDKIAYAVCSDKLSDLEWQDECKLSTTEQWGAASILKREGSLSGEMRIRVDRGHAVISAAGHALASMPITPETARRVIEADRNMQNGLVQSLYPHPERVAVLIGAIMSAHPALEPRGGNT